MLKSLHIGRYLSDPDDLRVVAEFLEAVGFQSVAGEQESSAVLAAPLGLVSLNALAKEYPAEIRERLKDVNQMIVVEVSSPDAIFDLALKHNLKILMDMVDPADSERRFSLELPGNIILTVHRHPEPEGDVLEGSLSAAGKHFAIVVSRFNAFITERLLQGARDALLRSGAAAQNVHVTRVPGAFEIPSAARMLAETGRYDALICIGCLLRGDTAHYDVIVNEVTRGIGQSAQETGVPHAFGVLTCDTLEQAIDRAGLKMGNKGFEAGIAGIEMANLKEEISAPHSSSSRRGSRMSAEPGSSTVGFKKTGH